MAETDVVDDKAPVAAKPNGVIARSIAAWLSSSKARRQTMINLLTAGVFIAWIYAALTSNSAAEAFERMALLLLGLKGGAAIANGIGK